MTVEGKRILWVEDHPEQIKYFVRALEKTGNVVKVVTHGEGAIDAILSSHYKGPMYDIILLDVMLPKGQGSRISDNVRHDFMGEELLRQMREKNIATPVVIVTCVADSEFEERVLINYKDLVKAILKKPVEPEELTEAISEAFVTPLPEEEEPHA